MRIAIDTGGTFTDCIFVRGGRLAIVKIPSTPKNPAHAIANALDKILAAEETSNSSEGKPVRRVHLPKPAALDLLCGTTVGTNALLERRGGRVALVATAGFEDVIEIGRQARPRLYDFFVDRPAPLVPRERRFGLHERVGADGRALLRPSHAELVRMVTAVKRSRANSVAVCLLFSFAHKAHERLVARALRAAGLPVSASYEILPEFREFERTATVVVNAYLVPVMSRYLNEIATLAAQKGRGAQVRVMQSSGGITSARVASREPVRTILSGPAGGLLGAQYVAECAGFSRVITFDMGGTSTDVALLDGPMRTTNESAVAELPVAVPMLDIHTVGAGGGSIARFDRAGALHVGPESAGADPGPICYGRGEKPTVTDAHLVLSHFAAEGLLGGELRLDKARTRRFLERARGPIRSIEQFAQGILDVADATMEKAIRVISVERGYDPRDYTFVAFGGAGGLHACALAAVLGIPRALVPNFPGGLSALGILRADVVKDFSQTVLLPVESSTAVSQALRRAFAQLEMRGWREMGAEGFSRRGVRIERLLDMRYIGQAFELTVAASGNFVASFHRAHERRYGYADPARPAEIVNVRIRVVGATPKLELPRSKLEKADCAKAVSGVRRAFFGGKPLATPVYDRARLGPGNRFFGPAIVNEYSATTLVPPGWCGFVDAYGNLVLERR